MKARIRYWLWKWGLRDNCPYCGGTMMQHGFEPDDWWSCNTPGCEFNNEKEGNK